MFSKAKSSEEIPENINLFLKLRENDELFRTDVGKKFGLVGDGTDKPPAPKKHTRFASHPNSLSSDSIDFSPEVLENARPIAKDLGKIKSASASKMYPEKKIRPVLRRNTAYHLKNTTNHFDAELTLSTKENIVDMLHIKVQESFKINEVFSRIGNWKKYQESSGSSSAETLSETETKMLRACKGNTQMVMNGEKQGDMGGQIEESQETEMKEFIGEKSETMKEKPKEEKPKKAKEEPKPTKEIVDKREETKRPQDSQTYFRKAEIYIEKCVPHIQNIKQKLHEYDPPPVGSDDFQRQTKRTLEFTSRFSRTYLYPFSRQLSMLKISSKDKENYCKFAFIFQMIQQALKVFLCHLPFSIGTLSHIQLKDYLEKVIQFCGKLKNTFARVKMLEDLCIDLSDQLIVKMTPLKAQPIQQPIRRPPLKARNHPTINPFIQRFSMYSTGFLPPTKETVLPDKKIQKKEKFEEPPKKPKSKKKRRIRRVPKPIQPAEKKETEETLSRESSKTNENPVENLIVQKNEDIKVPDIADDNENQEDILTKLLKLTQSEVQKPDSEENLAETIMLLQKYLKVKEERPRLHLQIKSKNRTSPCPDLTTSKIKSPS